MHGNTFGSVPRHGAAVTNDPHIIAAVPHHPLLSHMLLWIIARTEVGLWGERNDLTGPDGWRRVLSAYRFCEAYPRVVRRDGNSVHADWPSFLFNAQVCGCWGADKDGQHLLRNLTQPVSFRSDIINQALDGEEASSKCIGFHNCQHVYNADSFDGGGGLRRRMYRS